MDLVACLFKLATVGDEPRPRLERALAIVRKLDGEGKLTADEKSWIAYIEQGLAELPR
jgi:hypothetical protein